MTGSQKIWNLQAATYEPHALHGTDRDFQESNCYIDLWIEILHALGLDVFACLPFTVTSDFEGDQWTFFKPPFADLDALYGIRIEELNLWRPLSEHFQTQVGRHSMPIVEVDAYYLPDTSGTDYKQSHVKTSIGVARYDGKELGYFHNAGYYEVEGADLEALLGRDPKPPEGALPPYCEIAKLGPAKNLPAAELRAVSRKILGVRFEQRPAHNPFQVYAEAFPEHLELMLREGLGTYHAYSFAALRQAGANFELLGRYLGWLGQGENANLAQAAGCFDEISKTAKSMILKTARIVNSKKPKDLNPALSSMTEAWTRGMELIGSELER